MYNSFAIYMIKALLDIFDNNKYKNKAVQGGPALDKKKNGIKKANCI